MSRVAYWIDSGIEKLNSNLCNDAMQVTGNNGSARFGDVQTHREKNDPLRDILRQKEANEISLVESSRCFRLAQLITELLLVAFAASLLVVAVIVITSKRAPAMMQSYEIVPKSLFLLIIVMAIFSLCGWIWNRINRPALTRSGIVEQSLLLPESWLSLPMNNQPTLDVTKYPSNRSQSNRLDFLSTVPSSCIRGKPDPMSTLRQPSSTIDEESLSQTSTDSLALLDDHKHTSEEQRKYLSLKSD